ncbi:MAG TPA: hypothetical protein VEU97_16270, partial [Ktedonobacteraceae bacterium]|nr:hypothetical protein [Ktedonobacteraceae bacterium]
LHYDKQAEQTEIHGEKKGEDSQTTKKVPWDYANLRAEQLQYIFSLCSHSSARYQALQLSR